MTCAPSTAYVGSELEIFRHAHNWKSYFRARLSEHIGGVVAEVGAGIGATTEALSDVDGVTRWECVEPDAGQMRKVEALAAAGRLPSYVVLREGTLSDIALKPAFDTILYIDVLEHIDDDKGELLEAAHRLKPGGRLVVLAPAWQFLYSPFDAALGHYRRYTLASLRSVAPAEVGEVAAYYLDGIGFLASLANKLILKQELPRPSQIRTWDTLMVPISRVTDLLTSRFFGRSVVIVWRRTGS